MSGQEEAIRQRACVGKTKYRGHSSAMVKADEYTAKEGVRVAPYRCIFCGWWHVGHTPSMLMVEKQAAIIRARRD